MHTNMLIPKSFIVAKSPRGIVCKLQPTMPFLERLTQISSLWSSATFAKLLIHLKECFIIQGVVIKFTV